MEHPSPIYHKNIETLFKDKENEFLKLTEDEQKHVIVDTSTREICKEDIENAFNAVVDNTCVYLNTNINEGTSVCSDIKPWEGFCLHCTEYVRVQTAQGVNRGDVIRMRRYNGLYYHYAVVKCVQNEANQRSCMLNLIHLNKKDRLIQAQPIESTEQFNFRQEVVERVIYKSNRYKPDDIVKRAEEFLKNSSPKTYNPFDNCEHLVNKAAQDVTFSGEVYFKMKLIKSSIQSILNCFRAIGTKIMNDPNMAVIPPVVALLKIILDMRELENLEKNKLICFSCYTRENKKLKESLIYFLISLGMTVIYYVNPGTINRIISAALPNVAPIVFKHLMPLVQPAYYQEQITDIQNLKSGDVITFDYCNLPHEGVVADVQGVSFKENKIQVKIVHFPWPGFFKSYTVTEETMFFKPTGEVCVLNFEKSHHYSAYEVWTRARNQVGKQNFNCFSYRSSHLSRFCKTGDTTLQNLPKVPVRSIHDISPGDVISFRYFGLPHEAVVIKVSEPQTIRADIIHYNYNGVLGTREVIEETFTFTIGDRSVYIHDYSNLNTYEPEEVVKRARSRKGERLFNMLTNRSSHLARWCKVKETYC